MKKIMIWDIPIRVFHWGFAVSCVGALAIGLLVDDDSAIFPVHMLLGLTACFLLALRLALAIFGCRHNRLKAMIFSPAETLRYVSGIFGSTTARYFVHNPGTSAAAIGMFILVPFLLWTGLNSSGDVGEEVHEILAYALLALIGMHIAGLVVHTLRHRENISLSMVTGFKQSPPENGLRSSHPLFGAVMLLIAVAWIGGLFANYSASTRTVTLPLLRSTIQLGENEGDHHAPGTASSKGSGSDDHSDDDR